MVSSFVKDKHISRKALFSLIGLVGLLVLVFGGGGHLGLFSKVSLDIKERGPYTIIGIEYRGPYRKIIHKLKSVTEEIKTSKLSGTVEKQCAILYDSPNSVDHKSQRSLVGFVLQAGTAENINNYTVDKIEKREVLVAKIDAHPSVAFFRSYPKIRRWLKKNDYNASSPMLEIYYRNGLVELEVPITK